MAQDVQFTFTKKLMLLRLSGVTHITFCLINTTTCSTCLSNVFTNWKSETNRWEIWEFEFCDSALKHKYLSQSVGFNSISLLNRSNDSKKTQKRKIPLQEKITRQFTKTSKIHLAQQNVYCCELQKYLPNLP